MKDYFNYILIVIICVLLVYLIHVYNRESFVENNVSTDMISTEETDSTITEVPYTSVDKAGKGYNSKLHNVDFVSNIPKIRSNFDRSGNEMYKTGKSVRLNGKDSYIEIENIDDLYKNGFSFAIFFKLTEYISIPRREYILASCTGAFKWELLVNQAGRLEFRTRMDDTNIWTSLYSDVEINNEWFHVTIAQNHSEQHMFLNDKHFSY